MTDFTIFTLGSITGASFFALGNFLFYYFFPTKEIIFPSNTTLCWTIDREWKSIFDHPIPEDIKQFIACDGKEVKCVNGLTYNKKGQPVMGWDNNQILRWMPMPKYEVVVKDNVQKNEH